MNEWYRLRRVRPCPVCGGIWCDTRCPEYQPEDDPAVTGFCEVCGAALYADEERCERCKEEQNDG